MLSSLAKAGSWALWNGILINKYWLQILSAGGLSQHSEAMVLTKQLSGFIAD
jgi:hypothetical protein